MDEDNLLTVDEVVENLDIDLEVGVLSEDFNGGRLTSAALRIWCMATLSEPPPGVEFVEEDDGRVTARHLESGVASFGDTEAEALRELADALESHFDHGESIDDPEAWLSEQGIDVEIGEAGTPPWLD